ncbi:MAG TPA: ATP-binding cassette domain-containing protein, partial [Polyangiales bacterium]
MSSSAIRFRDVAKSFGKKPVFEGLELEVRRGEILTLVGASGCGKSVMLKLILGLMGIDHGSIEIEGEEISGLDERGLSTMRRKIGMLFQGGALFDSMNVFDNVSYALVERGERNHEALRARVAEVLAMVGLPGIEELLPSELSGGMKKRVALARAVAAVPQILLYDEPTTGLDPLNVRRISELIVELREKLQVTSVVVTHDLASAFLISDRMAMLHDRKMVEVADVRAFQESPIEVVRAFLGA